MKLTKPTTLASSMYFGKYKGKNVQDVIIHDPRYIQWCVENVNHFALDKEAIECLERSMQTMKQLRHYHQEVDYDYDEHEYWWNDPLNY